MKYWLFYQSNSNLPLRFNNKEELKKYWKALPKDVKATVVEFEKVEA